MTEQEAIEIIKYASAFNSDNSPLMKALDVAMKALEKQAEYKTLEEQGKLLELPCKVGDVFWEIDQTWLNPFLYPRTAHSLQHVVYCMERLGNTTFLTKEEAKAALEKMKGGTE